MSADPRELADRLARSLELYTSMGDHDGIADEYQLTASDVRAIIAALRVDPISRVRLSENDLTDAIETASAGMPSLSRSGDDDGGWSNRDFAVAILAALEAQLAEDGEA